MIEINAEHLKINIVTKALNEGKGSREERVLESTRRENIPHGMAVERMERENEARKNKDR